MQFKFHSTVCFVTIIAVLMAIRNGTCSHSADLAKEYLPNMDLSMSVSGTALYMGNPVHTVLGYYLGRYFFWNSKDLDVDMTGKNVLVSLAKLGAIVHIVCRSEEKGMKAVEDIKAESRSATDRIHLHICDVSSLKQIRSFVPEFKKAVKGKLHILVNNVAVMLRSWRQTDEGFESSTATNLVGFYLLTELLKPLLIDTRKARMVNVVSAGMYTYPLNTHYLAQLQSPNHKKSYDPVKAYSTHHRARVALTERWAEELKDKDVVVNCVHPGWVDTPGLAYSPIAWFHKLMYMTLRSDAEGADTVIWLAASENPRAAKVTGKFFWDRAERATSLPFAWTAHSQKDVDETVAMLDRFIAPGK
eukprot:Clim_evm4s75 gene=Clim_evmTU4s75